MIRNVFIKEHYDVVPLDSIGKAELFVCYQAGKTRLTCMECRMVSKKGIWYVARVIETSSIMPSTDVLLPKDLQVLRPKDGKTFKQRSS